MRPDTGISTAAQIDAICDWLDSEVCPRFSFKIPDNEDLTNIRMAPPKAYGRYFPVKENLPRISTAEVQPNYSAPSIVVMPRGALRYYDSAILTVHFLFTIWDPGEGGAFDHEAWRSVVNLQDETARQLAQQMVIGNMVLQLGEKDKPIEYGLVNDEDSTPDLRPYYMGYMQASFKYGVAPVKRYGHRPPSNISTLLD